MLDNTLSNIVKYGVPVVFINEEILKAQVNLYFILVCGGEGKEINLFLSVFSRDVNVPLVQQQLDSCGVLHHMAFVVGKFKRKCILFCICCHLKSGHALVAIKRGRRNSTSILMQIEKLVINEN